MLASVIIILHYKSNMDHIPDESLDIDDELRMLVEDEVRLADQNFDRELARMKIQEELVLLAEKYGAIYVIPAEQEDFFNAYVRSRVADFFGFTNQEAAELEHSVFRFIEHMNLAEAGITGNLFKGETMNLDQQTVLKKRLMAAYLVDPEIQDEWLPIVGEFLPGEPLDINSENDAHFIHEASDRLDSIEDAYQEDVFKTEILMVQLIDAGVEPRAAFTMADTLTNIGIRTAKESGATARDLANRLEKIYEVTREYSTQIRQDTIMYINLHYPLVP